MRWTAKVGFLRFSNHKQPFCGSRKGCLLLRDAAGTRRSHRYPQLFPLDGNLDFFHAFDRKGLIP